MLRVQAGENATLTQYNYVHVPAFSRYYYISNWGYNGDGTWTAACTVDALASWKARILLSSGYVGRRNAAQINNGIVDNLYPPEPLTFVTLQDSFRTEMYPNLNQGTFVLGVLSSNAPNVGAAAYYYITADQLANLVNAMARVGTADFSLVTSMGSDVIKSLVNPMQFIVSCKWFQFGITYAGTYEQIKLWGWNTSAYGFRLSDTSIALPTANSNWHLILRDIDAVESGINVSQYPTYPPFAEYSFITPWGTFELDPFMMHRIYRDYSAGNRYLNYRIQVDWISGTGTLIVDADFNPPGVTESSPSYNPHKRYEFARKEIVVALDIPLAQVSLDYMSIAKSGIEAAGAAGNVGAWITNPIQHGAGIANNMLDIIGKSLSPAVQSTAGAAAAFTPLIEHVIFQMKRTKRVSTAPALFGNPWKGYVETINSLAASGSTYAGYIQMDEILFEAPCADSETKEVTDAMMAGVYIE